MAIYHLSVKAVSRSAGRSATAAAAYRSGCKIRDERIGEIFDYTRRRGVESTDLILPHGSPAWATDRAKLWNAAELAEKRKDSCVAREFEVALPSELSPAERRRLALDFATEMANEEGCAVDVAIHAPGRGATTAIITRTSCAQHEGWKRADLARNWRQKKLGASALMTSQRSEPGGLS